MSKHVKKRQVFYIPGYDPMLPRRYRELYRTEGKKQALISGYDLELKARSGTKEYYGWTVNADIDGVKTETNVDFLLWSDIVQTSMKSNIAQTFVLLAKTAWAYIGTGALWRLMRLPRGPVLAALYPIFMLLLQLLVSLAVGYVAARLTATYIHWAVGIPVFAGVISALMIYFKGLDGKLYAYYLMHDYSFSARFRGANPPELEARMAEFVVLLYQALQSDVDEVLVVGHSSGAHISVSILADLLRKYGVPKRGPKLAFLSLGQVVPMVSFLPDAWRLRADLHYLSASDDLTWVDVSAPGDGCTFALCDPASVSGVAPEGQTGPLILSASFSQTLSPELFNSIKRRFFRLHFQYLCAFDQPKDYDYFQITAGPVPLATRYANRHPSPSKITTPANKFTSMSPQ